MLRRVCLALAVAAGLGAVLLLASGATVHPDGVAATCPSIIGDAYSPDPSAPDLGAPPPARGTAAYEGYRLAQACDEVQDRWTLLAGLAALVSLTAAQLAREAETPEGGFDETHAEGAKLLDTSVRFTAWAVKLSHASGQ